MDVKEKAGMVTDVKVDMKVNEYIYICVKVKVKTNVKSRYLALGNAIW